MEEEKEKAAGPGREVMGAVGRGWGQAAELKMDDPAMCGAGSEPVLPGHPFAMMEEEAAAAPGREVMGAVGRRWEQAGWWKRV